MTATEFLSLNTGTVVRHDDGWSTYYVCIAASDSHSDDSQESAQWAGPFYEYGPNQQPIRPALYQPRAFFEYGQPAPCPFSVVPNPPKLRWTL